MLLRLTSVHFVRAWGTVHRKEVKPCDEPPVSVWPTLTAQGSCEVARAKWMRSAPARDIWETSEGPLMCGPWTCAAWPYLALSRFVCTIQEHDLVLVSACRPLFKHFSGWYPAPSEQFQNDPLVLTAMCLENIGPSGLLSLPLIQGYKWLLAVRQRSLLILKGHTLLSKENLYTHALAWWLLSKE